MKNKRVQVLTINNFNSLENTGIISDIKTFEGHKVQSFCVISSKKISNEFFLIEEKVIFTQLENILSQNKIKFIKISSIKDTTLLNKIITFIKNINEKIKIVLDTNSILKNIDYSNIFLLITKEKDKNIIKKNSDICNIFIKNNNPNKKYYDYLISNGKTYPFKPKKISIYKKYGTKDILSSSIMANLSLGYPLLKSCLKGKDYVTYFLNSNNTKFGFYKYKH